MPIQMVCDSTPSLVSAAIRDSLHSTANNGRSTAAALSAASVAASALNYNGVSAHGSSGAVGAPAGSSGLGPARLFRRSMFDSSHHDNNDDDDPDEDSDLVETITQSLRQGQQVKPIAYEEAPSYSASLDKLKSKYIVLKATNVVAADVVVVASSGGDKNTSSVTTNGNGGGGPAPMQTPKVSTNGSATTTTTTTTVPMIGAGGAAKYATSIISTTASRLTGSPQNGTTVSVGSGSAPGTAGKDAATLPAPKRTLFPRENVQIGWKTTGRKWLVGAGMVNMGNTCYLNSTLQALFHVPAIANWLLSDVQHRERCDDGGSGGSCIICAMAKTLEESQSNHSAIKPYLVYSKLRLVCKHLVQGRQEDAHEFLRYLVEAMEKSFLGRYKNSKELDQYSKETTPLNQILGGYLRSEVKCLSCQHVSTTFQHFEDLLLDIRKASSIDEALELYFDRERLEDMGYKCEACKRRVAATKQFSLERAPFVLCIQLKRFAMMGGKINKHVDLRSRLDLTPYSNQRTANGAPHGGGKLIYRLTSMVTHLGSTQHCGHYTAIGQTDGGAYHVFDDSSVRPVGIQNVMSTNAYILFFELESAAGASVGLLNGTTKAAQTAGHPSSTATLTSMGHLVANGGGATLGSSSIGATGGSSGTPGKGTGIASSPLRVLGSGGGNGTAGGLFPSKMDTKPGFIGPVLPPSAKSPISAAAAASGTIAASQGTSAKGALGTTTLSSSAAGDGTHSSPSSTTSTLSSPSKTVSSSPSPVKSVNSSLLSQSNKSKSAANTMATTVAAPGSNNGPSALKLLNGTHTAKQSPLAAVSPPLPSMPKLLFSSTPNGGQRGAPGAAATGSPSGGSVVSLVPYETDDDSDADNSSEEEARNKRGKKAVSLKRNGHDNGAENDHHRDDDDDDDDGGDGGDDRHSHSPQIIKNKAGLWKVSKSSTAGQLTYPDSSSSNSGSASSSKTSSPSSSPPQQRNGGAAGSGATATAATGAVTASSAGGVQPLTNGVQRQQHTTQNGYNHQQRALKSRSSSPATAAAATAVATEGPAAAVQLLLKYSHRGYGAPVKSWNGQQTEMERELATERREERKRQIEDDRETEMDRGRMKKVKNVAPNGGAPPQHGNQFQHFQNYQNGGGGGMKWNGGNRNGNQQYNNGYHRGGGGHGGGGDFYQNGHHQRHGGGFRNGGGGGGGRRFLGGRNGGFHAKAHYHHQRSEASSGGGLASGGGGGPSGGSNGYYHR